MTRKLFAILIAAASLTALAQPASAQFTTATKYIGPTIGLGSIGDAGVALGGRFEFGFKELGEDMGNGTLGIQIGATYYSWNAAFFDYTYIPIGATVNFHFPIESNPKIDPFLGAGLGYQYISCDYSGIGGINVCSSSAIYFIGRAGVRYSLSEALALYGDVGAGGAALNVGVMFGMGN
jgi:hypothetical protein